MVGGREGGRATVGVGPAWGGRAREDGAGRYRVGWRERWAGGIGGSLLPLSPPGRAGPCPSLGTHLGAPPPCAGRAGPGGFL